MLMVCQLRGELGCPGPSLVWDTRVGVAQPSVVITWPRGSPRHWSRTPGLGWPVKARANDRYGRISSALITPSWIARASSASLLGAVRPAAAYLARARLMYC